MNSASNTFYILGPMTGYHDHNRPAFKEAAERLRKCAYDVVSPDELDETDPVMGEGSWSDYMTRDIPYLVKCDAGFALPGWQKSRGATLEAGILNALGRPVFEMVDGKMRRVPPTALPSLHYSDGVLTETR